MGDSKGTVPGGAREDAGQQGDTPLTVPSTMIQQAEAALEADRDTSTVSPAERRHRGHDVAVAQDRQNVDSQLPPPAFGDHCGDIQNDQEGFGTNASVTSDGRVNIRINERDRKLSSALLPTLKRQQQIREDERPPPPPYVPSFLGGTDDVAPPPPMNVVIQIVGSRGDVQPFIALGKVLKEVYGHRVRLATHPNFKDFVNENGLEFFSIGADPAALMAFMVKNPGLMPGFDALRAGDIGKRRREVAEYLHGCWRSCYETGDGTGIDAVSVPAEQALETPTEDYTTRPFVADCIIANPPSFAHIHIAEKMGIPVHIYFTMPYSPTQAFPHPLANIQTSNADENLTNYISYTLIEMLTWQGLGDVINRFRQRDLGLDPVGMMTAPGMLQRLRVPFTYCWSPALIPKPKDWGSHISISGFFFLDLASNYSPEADLKRFLDAGPPPVYIGFGSIVLDDPNAMTKLIFDAVRMTGQRALVSKGWGGMGADELGKPDDVFMLGNCPHDWLFKQVSCVVHHGGAGTTAAGITAGRPTVVVPFFGDQPFWGSMVARAGAGPPPIPHKELTAEKLADAIKMCLEPSSQERAHELAAKIAQERGTDEGGKSFHQFLEVDSLRCNLLPSRVAVWRLKRTKVRLSAMAACTLANEGLLEFSDLKLFRPREYETDEGPWEPITGGASAIIGTASSMMLGVADFPIETLKALKIHPDATKAKKGKAPVFEEPEQSSQAESRSSRRTSGVRDSSNASSRSPSESPSDTTTVQGSHTTASPPTSSASSTFNFQESLAKLNTGGASSTSPQFGRTDTRSLSTALSNTSRSRSRSQPRSREQSLIGNSDILRTTMETGRGVQRIVGAGLKSPMDFTLGVAKGFQNAPKLYGDDTVRKHDQVTDFKSGLKAAGKSFGFGMYDGITGLVSQPIKGAQKEGPAGFFKGIGKGIGGIVLKPGAAVFGLPGFAMQGIYKEMQKAFGSSVQSYIIAARTAQGYEDWSHSSIEERRAVVERWKTLQLALKKKRNPDEVVRDILDQQIRKKEMWFDSRKAVAAVKRRSREGGASSSTHDPESALLAIEAGSQSASTRAADQDVHRADERALQEAIRLSVQETSEGNAAEDARVQQAIQESMQHFLEREGTRPAAINNDDDDLQKAIAESAADAERRTRSEIVFDKDLERALAESLKHQRGFDDEAEHAGSPYEDMPPPYTPPTPRPANEPASAISQEGLSEKSQQEKDEEEIVLRYVQKQSLLEQEHRRKGQSSTTGEAGSSSSAGVTSLDEEDQELQRVLKLSLEDQNVRR